MNKNWSLNKAVNILMLGLVVGVIVSGCGGGGAGAGTSDATFSFVADQQSGGFVGTWWYVNSASAVAKADTNTVTPTGTNQYTGITLHRMLPPSATWVSDTSPNVYYDLLSSGWSKGPDTGTLALDNDGRHITFTPTGEPAYIAAITKTSLANTSIACTTTAGAPKMCATGKEIYPAGSTSYRFTFSYTSNQFILYGDTIAQPITDSTGHVLAALPLLNTPFCDPALNYVFQQQGSGLYKVFPTTGCTSPEIAAAVGVGAVSDGTVTIQIMDTNNTHVGNVLHVQSATGSAFVRGMVDMIYGLKDGFVWYGWMTPVGTYQSDPEFNKTAINAQLSGNGVVALP